MKDTPREISKTPLSDELHARGGAYRRYLDKAVGDVSFGHFVLYEFCQLALIGMGGAAGYLARAKILAKLFHHCGDGIILGRWLMIRKPGVISLGDQVSIDDFVQLDGGGATITIGDGAIISRGVVVQAKHESVTIGTGCDIGANTVLTSAGGIALEDSVLIAANCYIGGARYHTDDRDRPIVAQGIYTQGELRIKQGAWLGAAVTVIDGVTIGKGAVIGAGSVVTQDIPDHVVATGAPARVVRSL